MTLEALSKASPEASLGRWRLVAQSLTRPYRVTAPMVLLVSLVPLYIFIPEFISHREMNVPELTLDRLIPLKPSWALVYGSLYMFLIVLPVLALRDEDHIRRTVSAYLLVWIAAYICFLTYPTVAPRPTQVSGVGFGVWGLRALYSADPPYNCFPSLHVAHSFVSALTCYRLHRAVGTAAVTAASLVALSTLYTKQHYVLDVAAGVFLAFVAYAIFLRSYPRHRVSELDHQAAPLLALGLLTALGVAVAALWLVHQRG